MNCELKSAQFEQRIIELEERVEKLEHSEYEEGFKNLSASLSDVGDEEPDFCPCGEYQADVIINDRCTICGEK